MILEYLCALQLYERLHKSLSVAIWCDILKNYMIESCVSENENLTGRNY